MSIVNHIRNKIYLRSEHTHIIQILCRVPPIKGFFRGDFLLCVENGMQVLDPFFFHIKSWCRKILYI